MSPIFQTASEIAKEYEQMALEAHYQYGKLKSENPFSEFPGLKAHETFCCKMYAIWESIADAIYKSEHGDEMYGDVYDDWPSQEWGYNE